MTSIVKEDFRARLRGAGLRVTPPRLAVLERLRLARAPQSHADVARQLVPKGFDRVTVYRNLVDLAHAGLVTRSDVGDHVWRYELRRDVNGEPPEDHPHFVCSDCGTVACLPDVSVEIRGGKRTPRAVRGEHIEVQLRGVCDSCT